uniref:protein-tyrosine-phosphatase n=1 Tax=Lates calcarifer TaxID=8187 RepID=A0A4W6DLV3_LATCA
QSSGTSQTERAVTDYIYVGNLNAAYNGRTLCRNNIDSIIDMSSVPGDPGWSRLKCIDASTEKRKRVLVHCRDGFSLAPTCIIQYLMVKQNMRLIAAYELLRAKYPVNIRECHQNVLVSLERALRPGGNVDPELSSLPPPPVVFDMFLQTTKGSCTSPCRLVNWILSL